MLSSRQAPLSEVDAAAVAGSGGAGQSKLCSLDSSNVWPVDEAPLTQNQNVRLSLFSAGNREFCRKTGRRLKTNGNLREGNSDLDQANNRGKTGTRLFWKQGAFLAFSKLGLKIKRYAGLLCSHLRQPFDTVILAGWHRIRLEIEDEFGNRRECQHQSAAELGRLDLFVGAP
jgi:hypothetical protein